MVWQQTLLCDSSNYTRLILKADSFTYDELIQRDKVNLDIFWLNDETLEDTANLPDPDGLASEIIDLHIVIWRRDAYLM